MTPTIPRAVVQPLSDCDITWEQEPAHWPSPRPVLDIIVEAIPLVADDLAADVLTQAAETIVDLQTEVSATRALLGVALQNLHQQARQIVMLRQQMIALREDRRTGVAA